MSEPEIVRISFLAMQLCVPEDFTEAQILEAAERLNPSGTTNGWILAKEGDMALKGDPERVPCLAHPEKVHVLVVV